MTEFYKIPEGKEPTDKDVQAGLDKLYAANKKNWPDMFPEEGTLKNEWYRDHREACKTSLEQKIAKPMDTIPYPDKVDDYGDTIPVAEWAASCEYGAFIDYDGHGLAARMDYVEWTDGMDPTQYPTYELRVSKFHIKPSTKHLLPKDATHVVWYNR